MEQPFIDCIRLQKKKIRMLYVIIAFLLLVNLILSVMLCSRLNHKAADVKQTTTATASAAILSYDINHRNDTVKERMPYGLRTFENQKIPKKYRKKGRILCIA